MKGGWNKGLTKETDERVRKMYSKGKNKECPICKKSFYCRECEIERRKTCSKKCWYKYKSKMMNGKTPKNIKLLMKEGKKYRFNKGKHYSPKSEFKKGVPSWNKGIKMTKEKYPNYGLRKTREIIRIPKKDTSIEIKIQKFLSLLHIEFYTHYYLSQIRHSYQCDIFIPKQETEGIIIPQETIIECDGCYWHGCPKCDLNPYKKLEERKKLDKQRTKELQEKGFRVIRLRGHEIKSMELNDLRNRL